MQYQLDSVGKPRKLPQTSNMSPNPIKHTPNSPIGVYTSTPAPAPPAYNSPIGVYGTPLNISSQSTPDATFRLSKLAKVQAEVDLFEWMAFDT